MKRKAVLLFGLTASVLALAGCKPKKTEEIILTETPAFQIKQANHDWYFFGNNTITQVDKPKNAPYAKQLPYTEARRISSANSSLNTEKAFAVVNRLGILCFENDTITLAPDENLFADRTAGNLSFIEDVPVYTVYKSAFFNNTISNTEYVNDNSMHLFLLQFDNNAKISYPIINCSNLINEKNSEVIDFSWDGYQWLCCIKTISETKTDFSYISWKPTVSLLEISPSSAKTSISITESEQDIFRDSKKEFDYEKAPARIKTLLEGFSGRLPISVELKNAGGKGSITYVNNVNSEEKVLNAKGIISQSWSCVLFEDGTLFLEGALPGKHILRGGKPIAIRLPKLPAGFVYTDFVISGTNLYAGWEEKDFYNVSRSGFLKVDLDKTLYSKIR